MSCTKLPELVLWFGALCYLANALTKLTMSAWCLLKMLLCFQFVLTIGFEDLGIITLVISHLRKKLSILQLGIAIELWYLLFCNHKLHETFGMIDFFNFWYPNKLPSWKLARYEVINNLINYQVIILLIMITNTMCNV